MKEKNNKTFKLLDEYLNYLLVIRGRSSNTTREYKIDIIMFMEFLIREKESKIEVKDINIEFIKDITLTEMYSFISYCQTVKNACAGTRARKIVSIRQFWRYLSGRAHLLDKNIAEELETPKVPKRLPKYLTLEQSIRLLLEAEKNLRDKCIITIFLNCALRLSELVSLNVEQINDETISVIGKGNKERKIFLTPSTKKAISDWIEERNKIKVDTNALFTSRLKKRMTPRAVEDVVKKYLELAGLDTKKYSVHKLRHTAATLMFQYGKADIRSLQEILGHESISTTEIYTHVSTEQLERAVNSNPLATMF